MTKAEKCREIIFGSNGESLEVSEECFNMINDNGEFKLLNDVKKNLDIVPVENIERDTIDPVSPKEVEVKQNKKKEEQLKTYIPNFAYPFKRISKDHKEKTTYDLMMENLFKDKDTQYLFNRSGLFHGGVHLNGAKFCSNTFDTENIRAIANGKVVAYRINKEPLENEVNGETLLYTTGFFLIEHFMEYPTGNKLKFYSLYMHMAAMEEYEFQEELFTIVGKPKYARLKSDKNKEAIKEIKQKDGTSKKVSMVTLGDIVELDKSFSNVKARYNVLKLNGKTPSPAITVWGENLKAVFKTNAKGKTAYLQEKFKRARAKPEIVIADGNEIIIGTDIHNNRYQVFHDGTKKRDDVVSIYKSDIVETPKAKKKNNNGLVFQKMKTEEVVELDEKEQIEVKAGDVLGKLGVYSYDWIEEPVVHLEVFTFDDVKTFQKEATKAYEKADEEEKAKEEHEAEEEKKEKKYVVGNLKNYTYLYKGIQTQKASKGAKLKIVENKTSNRIRVLEIDDKVLPVNETWKISSFYVVDENTLKKESNTSKEKEKDKEKKEERPRANILYVPKETTELFEKGYDDTIYAKVTKNTNIRKGTTNDGEIYGKRTTKKGTELVLGTTTTETKVAKTKEKEAHSYYRQSVLEIAGKKVKGYSIHISFFEIIEKDVFAPKESKEKLKTPIVKPIKNLKTEKDKDDVEYVEVAKFPSLYVKKYKDKKQTKSWFTHGITLEMFDVMEKEGMDNIGIFDDTVSFYDQRDSNSKTQEEKEKLNPLFKEILDKVKIDKDKDGRLEAGELAGLSLSQEKRKELSYIVAKHESEWENPTRFEALATFMGEMKATDYAKMMRDRTEKLSFFDDVMAMDFSPTFFHPIALVGAMVGCIDFIRYDAFYASKGKGYKSENIVSWSHYNDTIPLDKKIKGNSRRWGDVSHIVQRQVIDELVKQGKQNEFSKSEICLLIAIARTESGFNPDAAAGTTSASGIGQFVKATASRMGLIDIFDMKDGITALIKLFKENRNIAIRRGKDPLIWIYKYHHDGANGEYGGMKIVTETITPLRVKFEKNINFCKNNSQSIPSLTDSSSVEAWIFDRESWTLTSNDGSVQYSQVYAGAPGHKNVSSDEALKNKGPLPKRLWKIIGKRGTLHGRSHSNVLVLSPEKGTNVYGRSAFLIHGDNSNGTGSNGCIIVNGSSKRLKIFNSKVKYLLVK